MVHRIFESVELLRRKSGGCKFKCFLAGRFDWPCLVLLRIISLNWADFYDSTCIEKKSVVYRRI